MSTGTGCLSDSQLRSLPSQIYSLPGQVSFVSQVNIFTIAPFLVVFLLLWSSRQKCFTGTLKELIHVPSLVRQGVVFESEQAS